ncbi:hypothetical protein ACEPAF_5536 [Sanghuangporus sanghuang]
MENNDTVAQRNRTSDDGPVREGADTLRKRSCEGIDSVVAKSIKPTLMKRRRTSRKYNDSDSDLQMGPVCSGEFPGITYSPKNMSVSRVLEELPERRRRCPRCICANMAQLSCACMLIQTSDIVHGPAIAEDCRKTTLRCMRNLASIPFKTPDYLHPRKLLSVPRSRILRKRASTRMVLAEITKPILTFSNPGQLQNAFNDYLLAISQLQNYGLAYRSMGWENLSISTNRTRNKDAEGILTSLDGVDVHLQKKRKEGLPSFINTLPAKLPDRKLNEYGFKPFDGPRQIFLCLIWIMTSRHGPCDTVRKIYHEHPIWMSPVFYWHTWGQGDQNYYGEPTAETLYASRQTQKAETLRDKENFESVIEYVHPYFDHLKEYLRVLRAAMYDYRQVIQELVRSRLSEISIYSSIVAEAVEHSYGEWWSGIMFDTALRHWDAHRKKTGWRDDGYDTDKAISFEAYEKGKLTSLPEYARVKESGELDRTCFNTCLNESSPMDFIRGRNTTFRLLKDKESQYTSENPHGKRAVSVASASKTIIPDPVDFSEHFYPQRPPRRTRKPIRVVLAEITKPVTYFVNPRQLFAAVKDYISSIVELQGLGLMHRLIGLESLSIAANVTALKDRFDEEPVGILTSLDGVDVRPQKPTEGQYLPATMKVVVNTLPARLASPTFDSAAFDHRDGPRQILLCLMWIITTRRGPYNDECKFYSNSGSTMKKSSVYKWHLLAKENRDGDDNDIKVMRRKKFQIMCKTQEFEENVVNFIQPYFEEFKTHLRLLRTALYDEFESFAAGVIRSGNPGTFPKDRDNLMWWTKAMTSLALTVDREVMATHPEIEAPLTPRWEETNKCASFEPVERGNLPFGVKTEDGQGADTYCFDKCRNVVSPIGFVRGRNTVARPVNLITSSRHCSCVACTSVATLSKLATGNAALCDRTLDFIQGCYADAISMEIEHYCRRMESEGRGEETPVDQERKNLNEGSTDQRLQGVPLLKVSEEDALEW